MISTFKETLTSFRDPAYAQVIIGKTSRQVLWYWSRYVIFFALISLLLSIFALTYFSPQFPKIIRDNVPDFDLAIKNGQLKSGMTQPAIWGNSDFVVILNTDGKQSDLDKYKSGILILKDKILAKSEDSQIQPRSLKDFGDWQVDKSGLISWLGGHELIVLLLGSLLAIVIAAVAGGVYWLMQVLMFLFWSGVLWLVAKFQHNPFVYLNCFKLVVYASVLPLIISAFTIISPSPVFSYLGLGLFIFYVVSWYRTLTK